jgi:hypothetical protein
MLLENVGYRMLCSAAHRARDRDDDGQDMSWVPSTSGAVAIRHPQILDRSNRELR